MRRVLVLILTAALFGSCSGSPTAPSSQSQTFTGTVAANGTDSKTISITKTGNLTLTLSSNSGLVLLYLTGTGCTTTDPFLVSFAGSCAFIGTANAAFTQVTTAVQSGQSYKFWVDSFDGAASHAWTVTLSVPN